MRRLVASAVVMLAVTGVVGSASCPGQFGGGHVPLGGMSLPVPEDRTPGQVTVLTEGGNQVSGMLADRPWKIKTEELGTLEVPAKAIASVEFDTDKGDLVTTRRNSVLYGHIELEAVEIESEFGPLSIDRSKVKSMTALGGGMMMGGMGGGMMMGGGVESEEAMKNEPEPKKPHKKGDGTHRGRKADKK